MRRIAPGCVLRARLDGSTVAFCCRCCFSSSSRRTARCSDWWDAIGWDASVAARRLPGRQRLSGSAIRSITNICTDLGVMSKQSGVGVVLRCLRQEQKYWLVLVGDVLGLLGLVLVLPE